MRGIICMILSYLIFQGLNAQSPGGMQRDRVFSEGKIVWNDFKIREASDIHVYNDTVTYYSKYHGKYEGSNLSQIRYIRIRTGSHFGMYAGIGLGLTAAITLNDYIFVSTNPNLVFKEDAGLIYLGLNAAGFLIGGLIGSAIPRWENYYPVIYEGRNQDLRIDLYSGGFSSGLTLSLNF